MNRQEAEQWLISLKAEYEGKAWAKWALEAFDMAIAALREKQQRQPDPDTGLVPCGCGGKAKIWLSDLTRLPHLITDYDVGCTDLITDYEVGCAECAMTTGWVRGRQENAVKVWNTAMGYQEASHDH